jgi:integrase
VQRQRRSTANRTLTILRAALNRAWREHRIASDEAWRRVQPFKGADAARAKYLTEADCARLINTADPDFRNLLQAALLTGARFGELSALLVEDFNATSGTMFIRRPKVTGHTRHIILGEEGIRFFAELAAGRPPRARMLLRRDGTRWGITARWCRCGRPVSGLRFRSQGSIPCGTPGRPWQSWLACRSCWWPGTWVIATPGWLNGTTGTWPIAT